jgi:uncharacterized membrane protein YfcA
MSPQRLCIGFGATFFDTLGIGSFAPTTALFRMRRLVDDELIPGTLNVGFALPVMLQATIFIRAVAVDKLTLVAMIAAAVLGGWLGAGVVTRMPRDSIRMGMGVALLLAAVVMISMNLDWLPGGGNEVGLRGLKLGVAVAANFVFGALMTLGIGLFAPCMIAVSLLGMDPVVAFPIMMGSCAILMPVAGVRFVRSGRYDRPAALGLTVGGLPAVLVAVYIVTSLPMEWMRWLVAIVVLYTALDMIRSALRQPFAVNSIRAAFRR